MSVGNSRNYNYSQKNHWRRTVWNEVLRRTAGREKSEFVLYLAGPQDIDRKIAIQKGVPSENLIAIDRDRVNVQAIRSVGASAIDADVVDVLWSWPDSKPVCAVMLDFCSGLEWTNSGVYDAFARNVLRTAIVMVNFQRGRDPFSNNHREALMTSGVLSDDLYIKSSNGTTDCVDAKNRSLQFLALNALQVVTIILNGSVDDVNNGGVSYLEKDDPDRPQFVAWCHRLIAAMNPKFISYRSGALVFDSCVFEHLSHHVPRDFTALSDPMLAEFERKYKDDAVRRKITAMLAVRTRRAAATV